ncbi:MAG TPA: GNAT family N-acetyltransferase [Gemmatimonadaceae bacterium]
MERPTTLVHDVRWYDGDSEDRARVEAELLTHGHPLPASARVAWARAYPNVRNSLLVVGAPSGTAAAIALQRHPSRALPGHYIVRVARTGAALDAGVDAEAIRALTHAMRADPRVIRVHFECFSRDASVRDRIGDLLLNAGFERARQPASYDHTLVSELRGTDNATHLSSLSQGVRQNIRALNKFPVELRPVRNVGDSARMNELMAVTFGRTGANHVNRDYAPLIRLATEMPNLARLMGVYRTDGLGGSPLIAFALGVNHGDHVAYDIGASTRVPEFKNLSLGYPLLWDLITWARAQGVTWFDFGGISAGSAETDDPVGRISDFKRRFEKRVERVSDEWTYVPHPARAAVARLVSKIVELSRTRGRR